MARLAPVLGNDFRFVHGEKVPLNDEQFEQFQVTHNAPIAAGSAQQERNIKVFASLNPLANHLDLPRDLWAEIWYHAESNHFTPQGDKGLNKEEVPLFVQLLTRLQPRLDADVRAGVDALLEWIRASGGLRGIHWRDMRVGRK